MGTNAKKDWLTIKYRSTSDRELHQQTIAGGLDDAPVMFGDCGVDELAAILP
jgi:hypothetical protein